MTNFKLYNKDIYTKFIVYRDIFSLQHLSKPLLVSPNVVEKKNKILYIGQETNTWGKDMPLELTPEFLEDAYDQFLKGEALNTPYWKFIKGILNGENLYDNVVWSNLCLCGKKDHLGTPDLPPVMKQMSVEYLTRLYEEENPRAVFITSSANSIYYEIVSEFLRNIKVDMKSYPTVENPVVTSSDQHVLWTYHPKYLSMKKMTKQVQEVCQKKLSL